MPFHSREKLSIDKPENISVDTQRKPHLIKQSGEDKLFLTFYIKDSCPLSFTHVVYIIISVLTLKNTNRITRTQRKERRRERNEVKLFCYVDQRNISSLGIFLKHISEDRIYYKSSPV